MKKIMTIIAMGVLCLCVTSCSSKIEEAYVAECQYKYYKSIDGHAAAAQFEAEFMELYTSMTYDQQQRYKEYRKAMEVEAIELATYMEHTKEEARAMLND